MNLEIELLENNEDERIFDLATLKALDDTQYSKEAVSEDQAFDKITFLFEEGNIFWLAKYEDRYVGYGVAEIHGKNLLSNGIYVLPEKRNEGIGFGLQYVQISHGITSKVEKVITHFDKENIFYNKILDKLGFKQKSGEYIYNF